MKKVRYCLAAILTMPTDGPVVEPIRILVRAEVSEVVAMKMIGHKTRSIFDRYDIVNQGDLNHAARELDEHMVTQTVTKP